MMKKYISVFGLFGKMSFRKIILCFVLLSVLQLSFYCINLNSALSAAESIDSVPILEETFITSFYGISFLVCLCLVCKFLISSQNHSEKTAYAVQRLQIDEKVFFYIQTVYNAFMLFFLFAVQTVLLFAMCKYYVFKAPSELVSEMSLFMAFYRDDFLHSVLPLDDTLAVFGNISVIAGLSFACAAFSFKSRRGKFSSSVMIFLALVCLTFTRSVGNISNDLTFYVIALIVIVKALCTLYIGEEEDEEID